MHPFRTITRRIGVAVLTVTGALVLLAAPAQAHDELIASSPADKSQVAVLPDQVVLTFEEPPAKTGSQVLIKGPNGNVQSGVPVFSGNKVSQAITGGSPAGAYTVTWRITADDGHAVFGTFAFTAAAGNTAASPTSTTPAAAAPSPSAASTNTASTSKSSAGKALWVVVLLLLIVPIWLFLRRGASRMREMSER